MLALVALTANAQKKLYIPDEWKVQRTDTLLYKESDPDNKYTWSKSRSKESDNFVVYWDKYYGDTAPDQLPSTNFFYVDLASQVIVGFLVSTSSVSLFLKP